MNKDVAVLLMLLCTLTAWVWMWKTVVNRRVARGKNRFVAHLIGALVGWGAAAGAFVLSGAILMPTAGERLLMAGFGTLFLLADFGMLCLVAKEPITSPAELSQVVAASVSIPVRETREPRKTLKEWLRERKRLLVDFDMLRLMAKKPIASPAESSQVVAASVSIPVCETREPRKTLKEWLRERKREKILRHAEKERERAAREEALGMSFGGFFVERMEEHAKAWGFVLFFVIWGYLFFSALPVEDWTVRLVASFIIMLMLIFFLAPILFLVLMPFACISIYLEARWRIRDKVPYVAPPVASYHEYIPPQPRSHGTDWIVPLALGLWIGGAWGGDD